jgi:hypothetical protein
VLMRQSGEALGRYLDTLRSTDAVGN